MRLTTCLLTAGFMMTASLPAPAGEEMLLRAHEDFIDKMVEQHGFERDEVANLLKSAIHRQDIIDAISRPAEALPWHRYRAIFLTEARAVRGAEFWKEHRETIERAELEYGVAPELIVAIIGVESNYGRIQGRYPVMDALVTLGFGYPPRADFFRSELEHFLLLAHEEGIDPRTAKGSYAGAMGSPQFISSSYRAYAVDFDGSGDRDLWNSWGDIIGSVANYFHQHGWRRDGPVAVPACLDNDAAAALATRALNMTRTVGELRGAGVQFDESLDDDLAANLLELEMDADGSKAYWVTLHNFFVITRYNRSPLYSLAVYKLARDIRARHDAE